MAHNVVERNNVTIIGEGEIPIVFAHGFGCDQNMWRFITPALKENFKIILFDYVGSGNSDISAYKTNRYCSLEGYVQDVLDIIHALDLDEVIFVGHSVSSIIGALASIEEPQKFEHLIMIGPSPCYLNDPPEYFGGFDRSTIEELLQLMEKNYIGWAEFFAPEMMKNEDKPELTEELEESFCSTDPVIAHQFAKTTFLADNREDLSEIEVPVLIIQCEDDSIAPLHVGKYVHAQINESTFEVLPTNGHCPHMTDPELTIEAIDNYLEPNLATS
ncbi:sigma-B regulation protein RsbQ [Fodinibius salinus]|uniref:Sigma-B regulation protein RsbQ n=1 Tax=Fodinibius salinus TaxID=860790 RepID=A0A5D3YKY6_9BACT|nr:alpha/beta hydrolase [Fodinibius salinus]TYP93616.1 sigma-B regulation protein RsbQ [Fodinibius salinus]